MFISPSDYGPFAPVVGYAGAIMAAGGALFMLFGGKMEKWRPPDEALPGTAQSVVLLLCGVGMVLQWYLASPASIKWFLVGVTALAIACIVCFLRYSGLLAVHVYSKEVATSTASTRFDRILGGRDLRPEAKAKYEAGVDVETLLEGAANKPEKLWSRESRNWVKQRVLLFFMLTLFFGTSALTGASFATQVLLTQKAASSVIQPSDATEQK
jgi:hypothetical protein